MEKQLELNINKKFLIQSGTLSLQGKLTFTTIIAKQSVNSNIIPPSWAFALQEFPITAKAYALLRQNRDKSFSKKFDIVFGDICSHASPILISSSKVQALRLTCILHLTAGTYPPEDELDPSVILSILNGNLFKFFPKEKSEWGKRFYILLFRTFKNLGYI